MKGPDDYDPFVHRLFGQRRPGSRLPGTATDIYAAYTRQQKLMDGLLVDLSDYAWLTGFHVPISITAEAWDKHFEPGFAATTFESSVDGRLYKLMMALRWSIATSGKGTTELIFFVELPHGDDGTKRRGLKAAFDRFHSDEPEIVIMMPDEDGRPLLTDDPRAKTSRLDDFA